MNEAPDFSQALAQMEQLEQAGARGFDPVRMFFLDALSRRTDAAPDSAKALLQGKLAKALAGLQADFEQSRKEVKAPLDSDAPRNALRELTLSLAPHDHADTSRTELKAVRQFRSTWSKLSTQKQLTHALAQAPQNAGPINSHMLVLRSLALMRDISPDYLNRFMSYADTLLCLDQRPPEKAKRPAPARTKTRSGGDKAARSA